ncbi:MAG: hypothetical protein H6833_11540 [Planctomycetes bacterium]|nr:hypothetical protein [Planctomycetota bacterium]
MISALLASRGDVFVVPVVAITFTFGYLMVRAVTSNWRGHREHRDRMRFLERALEKGVLTREDLDTVLEPRRATRERTVEERLVAKRERSFWLGSFLLSFSLGFFLAGRLVEIPELYIPGAITGTLGLAHATYGLARREVLCRIRQDVEQSRAS